MSNIKLKMKRFFVIAVACFCTLNVFVPTKAEDSDVTISVDNYHQVSTIDKLYTSDRKDIINLDFTCHWSGYLNANVEYEILENPSESITIDEWGSIRILKEGTAQVRIRVGNTFSDPITVEVRRGNYASAVNLSDCVIYLKSTDTFNMFSYLKDHMYTADPDNDLSDEISGLNLEVEKDPSLITIETDGNILIHHRGSASIKVTTVRNEVHSIPVVVMDDPVQAFRFQKNEIKLRNNDSNDMMAWLETDPAYAIDGIVRNAITWTSSDPSIASFDYDMNGVSSGYLATHQEGDVTVTASWNGKDTSMSIHVADEDHHFSSDINHDFIMGVGNTKQLTYTIDSVSQIVSKEITSGTDVVTFDKETDTVTALKPGNAEITYTDDSGYKLTYCIEVRNVSEQIEIHMNERSYVLRPENPVKNDYVSYSLLPDNTDDVITFSVIEGTDVVEIPNEHNFDYVVKGAGDAIIRATLSNGAYADLKIHAIKGTYAEWFDSSNVSLEIRTGESLNIKDEFEKRLCSSVDTTDFSDELKSVKYNVSDRSILRLDDKGILTGISEGFTYIEFRLSNGECYSFNVYVSNQPIKEIRFYKDEYSIGKNEQLYFKNELTSIPDYMNGLIDESKIKWTSSDHSIAMFKYEMDEESEWYNDPSQLVLSGKTGDITVTAEYEGMKVKTVVHVYDAENKFEIKENEGWNNNYLKVSLKPGDEYQLEYELGEGNEIISKEKVYGSSAFVLDSENDTVKVVGTGRETICYQDLFGNKIEYALSSADGQTMPTDFSFRGDYRFGFRTDMEAQQVQSIFYRIYPFDAQETKIKWELIGDSSVLEPVESTYSFSFIPLKAGTVTLKGTTENGLTASCKIELLEGDYATGVNWSSDNSYTLKPGETLDLAEIAETAFLPEKAELKDEAFSYSVFSGRKYVSVDDNGLLTAVADGYSSVSILTTSGYSKNVDIYVMNGINGLSFEKDYYEIPFTKSNGWYQSVSLKLITAPIYAAGNVENSDITISSSDNSIMFKENVNGWGNAIYASFKAYSPGEVVITAKHGEHTAQTKVLLYEEKPQTVLNLDEEMEIRKGYSMFVPYSFGDKEKTDCYLKVLDQSDSIVLNTDRSAGGYFEIFANKPGSSKIRVTSVDDPNLYKDIRIKVNKKAPIDFRFQMTMDGENLEKDKDGYYVLVYGEMYGYSMETNARPQGMTSLYEKLIESGVLNSDGGAGVGAVNNIYGEYGSSRAGKVGTVELEVMDGITVKFKVVSDVTKADYGNAKIENKSGQKYHIDADKLEKTQKKLTKDINDRIDAKTLQDNVNEISSQSDVLLDVTEVPNVTVDTNTTISVDEKNKALVYDITPIVKLSTVSNAGIAVRNIGETTTDISKTIEMELPVGDFIQEPDKPVYVVHIKEDGTKYVYEGNYDPESKTVKVTNPHGFSSFQITQVKPVVNQSTGSKPSVDTSDNIDLILYAGAGVAAIAIMGLMIVFRKKHS